MPIQANAKVVERIARFNDLTSLNFAGLVRLSFELNPNTERIEVPLTGKDINNREDQEDDCRKSVASRGGRYVYTYDEPDTSAWKKKKVTLPDGSVGYRVVRPVFEQALRDLKAGIAPNGEMLDGLIVWDIDRLVREHRYLEDAIDVVMYHGRPIIDITGTLDLLTENGRDMARVLVTMIGKQSSATSRRVANKHYKMAIRGIPASGRRPFGWLADKKTKDPEKAALLAKAAEDVVYSDIGVHTIVREWNKAGVRTDRGFEVSRPVLRNMLLSPRIAGFRVYQGAMMLDPEGKPVKGQHEAILDEELWHKVVDKLTDPMRTGNHVHRGGRKYLLSAIIVCALCSRQLTGNADNRYNNFNYVCEPPTSGGCGGVSVNGPHVDKLVTELVLTYLSERTIEQKAEPWSGEQQLADANEQVAELMGAYRRKELPGVVVFPQVKDLQATVDALQAQRSDWNRKQKGNLKAPSNIVEMWPQMSTDRQRAVIETLDLVVIVKPSAKGSNRFDPARIEVIFH
ncbi:DNA invertase Pin-like site-specific DNA recombinase [Kibdelosporangium banguiense]|uniref:DNA invertase Pin-like site-specific DNA recombinase n=1 Tax=Kibdelosporangium banguiense TaxID=1365924 RepID=A0ABS4TE40_9PSEU|nr:recombinase family protein [Kibdelosporangium banguiense]MBP2322681.1 DNA invertase Pin-like site-specific DNA recombinase [Kibdelosporangium banguiense]